MSYPWRVWLGQQDNETLGVTQEERDAIEAKKHIFCGIGDKKIKEESGGKGSIDVIFDKMPEEQKLDFTIEVLNEGLQLLGLRKKKNKNLAQTKDQEQLSA